MHNSLQWFLLRHDRQTNKQGTRRKTKQLSQMTKGETDYAAPLIICHTGLESESNTLLKYVNSHACLAQSEAGSWSLSGAGRDAGQHRASVVGASLCTVTSLGLSDADAHLCTGNTTTCCRVYTGSVQVLALNTLSSSDRHRKPKHFVLKIYSEHTNRAV